MLHVVTVSHGVHKGDHCMTMVCSRNRHDEHVYSTRTCCVHAGKIVRYLIDYLEHAQNLVYMFMYKVHRPDKVHDFTSSKSIMQ